MRFSAAKSPLMTGDVMRVGDRYLVDWDDESVDVEPWLDFHAGKPITLTLAKTDPDGDFSSDYEDLHFTRLGNCKPQPEIAPRSESEVLSRIDALMRDYAGNLRGASVLVLRDGKPIVRRSYGVANPEDHIPATNFRLASMTKQLTAASILRNEPEPYRTALAIARLFLPGADS